MDEVLIGRPFFQTFGFDLDSPLRSVRDLVHKHVDEINYTDLKATSSHYKGLECGAADDDPIELPETAAATIGGFGR